VFSIAVALAQNPTNIQVPFPVGSAGNGTIWYQSSDFFTFENVLNPLQVEIAYNSGTENTEASICLNSNINFPVFGINLDSACPSGGFGTAANTSQVDIASTPPSKLYQRKFSNTKSQFIGARMALSDSDFDTDSSFYANLFVKPGQAGLVVTLPDQDSIQKFQIFLTGKQCSGSTYPIGSGGACQTIGSLPAGPVDLTLAPNQWQYYQWQITNFDPTLVNELVLQLNNTDDGAALFVQEGYLPSAQWFLNTYNEEDDGNTTYTIMSPGDPDTEVFFIGITNTGDESIGVHFNYSTSTCPAGQFGFNCQHKSANTTDPSGGYLPLGATLTKGSITGVQYGNNGTAWPFDYSDNDWEGDYAYFSLVNYPTNIPTPFYVRVSVADNNDGNSAPGFFAKQGGYPSAQSNHYNVSTDGDVTHQIIIEVDDTDMANQGAMDSTWFFAVQLPSNFVIWVGVNCADNCSAEAHGACYCNGELCSDATTNYTNAAVYYALPTSLEDSAGACTCEDDAYDESYDCSTKNNPYLWLWILLIVIAVIVVIVIAVAVPAFFIYQQRQKRRSGYDVVDGGAYD